MFGGTSGFGQAGNAFATSTPAPAFPGRARLACTLSSITGDPKQAVNVLNCSMNTGLTVKSFQGILTASPVFIEQHCTLAACIFAVD